jgi:hypothetical protein
LLKPVAGISPPDVRMAKGRERVRAEPRLSWPGGENSLLLAREDVRFL